MDEPRPHSSQSGRRTGFRADGGARTGHRASCSGPRTAATRLATDGRGLPVSAEPVAGGQYDFATPRRLEGVELDDCFTGLGLPGNSLGVPAEAEWAAALVTAAGTGAAVWGGAGWRYLQCFTADTLPGPDRRRAVALEPMTCPPNALRSGDSLMVLRPGRTWRGRFGIMPLG